MTYEFVRVNVEDRIGTITLNRPNALNALCAGLVKEMAHAVDALEANDEVAVIILTGSEKAFAAGADIKEMCDFSYMDAYKKDFITAEWERIASTRKPTIAAVAGYALGGGCELAMMCDIIIAADTAKFGQPEITIGAIPGAGGTQRLTRAIGKAKAMEMCLTGRMMDAEEAERSGLVARVVPADDLIPEARKTASKIASMSQPIVMMAKEAVDRSFEGTLSEGILFERRTFHSVFATEDQKEGMAAFIEKRKPVFKDR